MWLNVAGIKYECVKIRMTQTKESGEIYLFKDDRKRKMKTTHSETMLAKVR